MFNNNNNKHSSSCNNCPKCGGMKKNMSPKEGFSPKPNNHFNPNTFGNPSHSNKFNHNPHHSNQNQSHPAPHNNHPNLHNELPKQDHNLEHCGAPRRSYEICDSFTTKCVTFPNACNCDDINNPLVVYLDNIFNKFEGVTLGKGWISIFNTGNLNNCITIQVNGCNVPDLTDIPPGCHAKAYLEGAQTITAVGHAEGDTGWFSLKITG